MSELHRAIQERGDAFRPDHTPPFQALRDRKRRRDQRRAGAAVGLSVAAVLGIALVPNALGSDGGGGTPDPADQAQGQKGYTYRINWMGNPAAYSDSVYQALSGRCLTLPGLSDPAVARSLPPALNGRIRGKYNADAFSECAEKAAPGANVEVLEDLTEQPAQTAYILRPAVPRPQDPAVAQEIERCLELPGVSGSSIHESNPPTYGATVQDDAKGVFEDCAREVALYRLELAGRAASSKLSLAEMQALATRIGADADGLNAQGVILVAWGPNASRRQVNVGVASDLTTSDRLLRARYGDDILVFSMRKVDNRGLSEAALSETEARRLVRQLRNFATNPSASTAQQLPFAPTVRLGLGQKILKQATPRDLQQPGTWAVPTADGYDWLAEPTVSALDLLTGDHPHTAVLGPHPHCASPPRPGPVELAASQRVSTQPVDATSCNAWYTVDMFVREGKIEAVTLDLWEP